MLEQRTPTETTQGYTPPTEEEIEDIRRDVMGEVARDQKRAAWKTINELARTLAYGDMPDPEEFRRLWEEQTSKVMNIQTFQWAMKKAKHFRANYAGMGAEDFGIYRPER